MSAPAATSLDAFLGGRLLIEQPTDGGHRAGLDAIMLAAAVTAAPGDTILDLGAGVGTAGLAVLTRIDGTRAILVEIEPTLCALAAANAARNGLGGQVEVIRADIGAPAKVRHAAGLIPEIADHVLVNPPFHAPGTVRRPPDATKERAYVEAAGLDAWLRVAASLLRPGGTLTLIHRAEALGEVIAASRNRFGGLRVLPLFPRAGAAASRIVVSARKGSRAPLALLAGLVLHEADTSRYTAAAEAVLRGAALPPDRA